MAEGMVVELLLFARMRELCDNQGRLSLEVTEGASAADCFAVLAERFPAVARLRETLAVAVNEEYADWNRALRQGDVLSFIPPVSGG